MNNRRTARALLSCVGLSLGCAGPAIAAEAPSALMQGIAPLHGKLVLKSMPLSPIVHRKVTTWIYLSPGYDSGTQRYPVFYLLHGQPGTWTDCYRSGHMEEMADSLIAAGQMQPAILVAFDGDGPKGPKDMTNFCNRATDGYRAEDFIVQELVPYIDATYRTRPRASQRALIGYSAGGYGALNLGLKHPDVFGVWCSHAGFYSPQDDAELMTRILGPRGLLWDANNPLLNVKSLRDGAALHVYMDAAEKEEGFDEFQQLLADLTARGVDCATVTYPKAHAWRVVRDHCRDSFLFADRAFKHDADTNP